LHVHSLKAGLAVACLTGGVHCIWALLVALGLAQPLIDLVFWMHFIKPVYAIEPFAAGRAMILVAATSFIGFSIGALFGLIWNRLQGRTRDGGDGSYARLQR
jgi:hypothetical protein